MAPRDLQIRQGTVTEFVRVPTELDALLVQEAHRSDQSKNAIIVTAITAELEHRRAEATLAEMENRRSNAALMADLAHRDSGE